MYDKNVPIIKIINISKRFNGKAILSKINLTIYSGEIIGLTGPIGAGKTTLVQTALGLITPDTGSIQILGKSLEKNRQYILQKVNFASSSLRLNGYSSVFENLITFARLYNISRPTQTIIQLAKTLKIGHLLEQGSKVYKLSAGENATVNLCKALLNNPAILFFDEITAHMDPLGISRFYTQLEQSKRYHRTTILISQNLQELQTACDRIIYMDQGTIKYIFKKNQFKKLNKIYV